MSTIRWGLCCTFLDAPVKFRHATHRYVSSMLDEVGRAYVGNIVRANALALAHAVERCHALGIGAFRINSQILPLGTHPESGYTFDTLENGAIALAAYRAAGIVARERSIRLSFHPDQFVVLNSDTPRVVDASVRELDFQAMIAEVIGADVITLHGGGGVGGKKAALARLERSLDRLSTAARARIALENDDRLFTPADLLPLCERTGVPMVYDIHHHRCAPDGMSIDAVTERATATWRGREPYFHISSPRDGWTASNPRPHAEYIDPSDFPDAWRGPALTVDVEAKAKELAVVAIKDAIESGKTQARAHRRGTSRQTARWGERHTPITQAGRHARRRS